MVLHQPTLADLSLALEVVHQLRATPARPEADEVLGQAVCNHFILHFYTTVHWLFVVAIVLCMEADADGCLWGLVSLKPVCVSQMETWTIQVV